MTDVGRRLTQVDGILAREATRAEIFHRVVDFLKEWEATRTDCAPLAILEMERLIDDLTEIATKGEGDTDTAKSWLGATCPLLALKSHTERDRNMVTGLPTPTADY